MTFLSVETLMKMQFSICLHKFLQENSFVTRQTEHTVIHPNGKDVSTIDFLLYKSSMEENVLDIKWKTEYLGNVSDHHPVSIVYSMNFSKLETKASGENSFVPKINWKKVDKQ